MQAYSNTLFPSFFCFLILISILSPTSCSLLPMASSLKALVVFRNYVFQELIRAVHVYGFKGVAEEHAVEREYLLGNVDLGYQEIDNPGRLFTLEKFDVYKHYPGLTNGVWDCIFVFHGGLTRVWVPRELSFSWNPNVALLHNLARDLETIYWSLKCDDPIDMDIKPNVTEVSGNKQNVDSGQPSLGTQSMPLLDLNSPPSEAGDEETVLMGTKEQKCRRVAAGDISLEDLTKYFNTPIAEASKALNVGLTLLKRKCRQFGISRWPHRKIKSLGALQVEIERQLEEDETAALKVAKRWKMIENEKENIVKKPSLEIQLETRKIRQEIYKLKYKAKMMHERRTLPLF